MVSLLDPMQPHAPARPEPNLLTWRGVHQSLAPEPGYEYGTVLPLRRAQGGDLELALPGMLREPLRAITGSLSALERGEVPTPGQAFETVGLLTQPVGAPARALGSGLRLTSPHRVSTRAPWGAGAPDPTRGDLAVDTDVWRQADPAYSKNVGLLRDYPATPEELARTGSAADLVDYYRGFGRDNLLYVYDRIPQELRQASQEWYHGANRVAQAIGQEYDVSLPKMAGVLAVLSPQKDWYQNVDQARRVVDIWLNRQNFEAGSDMAATIDRIFAGKPYRDRIKGKRLSDLEDKTEQAAWLRAYDETYNPRDYRLITPEGEAGPVQTTAKGAPAATTWGSVSEIEKALRILEGDGTLSAISPHLGQRHKVRSFFNNIAQPESPWGDVTADTHAVAGNLFMPLGGNDLFVAQNFGNYPARNVPDWLRVSDPANPLPAAGKHAQTGLIGTYPLHADIVRDAARARGVLPREMQSVTWEAFREMFAGIKTEAGKARAARIWDDYRTGRITADAARQQIMDLAGGLRTPWWAQRPEA